jgi:hypothetical protein
MACSKANFIITFYIQNYAISMEEFSGKVKSVCFCDTRKIWLLMLDC